MSSNFLKRYFNALNVAIVVGYSTFFYRRVLCNQCNHEYSTDSPPAQIGIVYKCGYSGINSSMIHPPVLKVGVVPLQDELKTWSRENCQLIDEMWSSLKIENGLLWRWCLDGRTQHLQLVLPSVLRHVHVLDDIHSCPMRDI